MKFTVALALILLCGASAYASWDESDVKDVLDTIPQGKRVSEKGDYPNPQTISFTAEDITYRIDLRAKLCFAQTVNALTPVPCKSLKEGYAIMAPLITWEN